MSFYKEGFLSDPFSRLIFGIYYLGFAGFGAKPAASSKSRLFTGALTVGCWPGDRSLFPASRVCTSFRSQTCLPESSHKLRATKVRKGEPKMPKTQTGPIPKPSKVSHKEVSENRGP